MEVTNRNIGVWITRLLLGLIFFFQGFGKCFTIGIKELYKSMFLEQYQDLLPPFLLWLTAYYTSIVELVCGFMLVLGFKRDWAIYLLGSVLVIVTFGHGLATPVWNLSDVMFRAILLIALLLFPKDWDVFTLDNFIMNRFRV